MDTKNPHLDLPREEDLKKVSLVNRLLKGKGVRASGKIRTISGYVQYKGKEVLCRINSEPSDENSPDGLIYLIALDTEDSGYTSSYQYSFFEDGSSLYGDSRSHSGKTPKDFDKTFEILSTFHQNSKRDISRIKASTGSQVDAVNDDIKWGELDIN